VNQPTNKLSLSFIGHLIKNQQMTKTEKWKRA